MAILLLTCCVRVAIAEPTLSADVVGSATPPAAAVDSFMSDATKLLQSEAPPEQEMGRNAIAKYAAPPINQPQPTAGFLLAYSKALNGKLLPLAKHPNWRVRLNAILAAEKVASKAGNASDELVPTIKTFLGDSNEGVALWAVKASKHVVGRQPSQVVPALVAAVKQFPMTAASAYEALNVKPPKPEFLTAVQDIMEARIAQYAQGVPHDPSAEKFGILRLVDTQAWKVQTPQQQVRTGQIFANLASAVLRQITPETSNDQKEELTEVVRTIGAGMVTIGQVLDPSKNMLTGPGQKAQKLPRAAAVTQIQAEGQGIFPALKGAFPSITQPMLSTSSPATNPAVQDVNAGGR